MSPPRRTRHVASHGLRSIDASTIRLFLNFASQQTRDSWQLGELPAAELVFVPAGEPVPTEAVAAIGVWVGPVPEHVRTMPAEFEPVKRLAQPLQLEAFIEVLRQVERADPPAAPVAWAQSLHAQPELQNADATALATAVLRHIRSSQYTYTLEPGTYDKDPVDEFWLDRKLGFCEHYASAFTVIMRAMGIPARIVTGYQGTDETEADGYWIVRQSHAHAWAEYWQQGRGWLRADPTSAVAPDRIQRSRALEVPQGLVAGTLEAVSPDLRLQLRQFFESMDNRWNQWVLGYGKQQQFQLMDKLGLDARDTGQLV
ncbi:transglutaminase-like domain-containing protein, partial [Ideonella azotifigens]|uniref:transglutaminase-like domain-containing protein n=1 Tax=Ideonella azotifigens TaxID=513160 RepID=UPI001F2246BA